MPITPSSLPRKRAASAATGVARAGPSGRSSQRGRTLMRSSGRASRIGTRVGTARDTFTTSLPRTPTSRTRTADRGDVFVLALIDNVAKEVISVFAPVEIVLSVASASGLLDQAIRTCPHLAVVKRTYIARKLFNETHGALTVEKLGTEKCPNLSKMGLDSCYLALASAGALLRHVEQVEGMLFSPKTLRIRFQPNDHAVFLDLDTLQALEILMSGTTSIPGAGSNAAKMSLLRVLDKTVTRAGKRMLRRELLEPCVDVNNIRRRQDAVEELSGQENRYFVLTTLLKHMPDLESSLVFLMHREHSRLRALAPAREMEGDRMSGSGSGEDVDDDATVETDVAEPTQISDGPVDNAAPPSIQLIKAILNIKAALFSIPPLIEALDDIHSETLRQIAQSLRDPAFSSLEALIAEVVEEEVMPEKDMEKMHRQSVFAVKKNRNGRLDMTRRLFVETREEMDVLTNEMRNQFGMHKMQLCVQASIGFHFSIKRRFLEMDDLPDEFIPIDKTKQLIRFTSLELGTLNVRYKETLLKIWTLAEVELSSLLNTIMKHDVLLSLYRLCDATAVLDYLTSLVTYASRCGTRMQRPRVIEEGPITFRKAYHPVLLHVNPDGAVPNDVYMDETSAVHIITGPNQSGKSTFLQMVGHICVMAHMGCDVPAGFASVRVLKRIATLMKDKDDLTQSQSHFSTEMRDNAEILRYISDNEVGMNGCRRAPSRIPHGNSSHAPVVPVGPFKANSVLLLMDEFASSTRTLDGFCFAFTQIVYLAHRPNVLTLFATHFLALNALCDVKPMVKAFHMESPPIPPEPTTTTPGSQDGTADATSVDTQLQLDAKFPFRVAPGVTTTRTYGIETARQAGFPEEVVQRALSLRDEMPVNNLNDPVRFGQVHLQVSDDEKRGLRRQRACFNIAQRVIRIRTSSKADEVKEQMLQELARKVLAPSRRMKGQSSVVPQTSVANVIPEGCNVAPRHGRSSAGEAIVTQGSQGRGVDGQCGDVGVQAVIEAPVQQALVATLAGEECGNAHGETEDEDDGNEAQ